MEKIILILLLSLSTTLFGFSKKAVQEPVLVQDEAKYWCPITGLKLQDYYKTSYIARLEMNGRKRQYSSLYALIKDMQEYGIKKGSIKVLDLVTDKYIDPQNAFFIIGSKIKGTLSLSSKFAFSNKDAALKFQKKYHGKLLSFNEALKSAEESLKKDESYFLKIKKKKEYPRGKKIFQQACKQDIDPTEYLEINELKEAIVQKKLCSPLNEKNLQALSLYLWDVKRFGGLKNIEDRVVVHEDEKCPVCGMFTYKYPRWAAQIFYKDKDKTIHYSFDGVKDLMKFYFDPKKWGNYPIAKRKNIEKILVTDYYSQKGIDGTKAYYVIRSDIYGPMGHELIPFASKEDAKVFLKDHYGKKILRFDQITEKQVYKLDVNE